MSILVVVDKPGDWPLSMPEVTVVAARAYLTDPAWGGERGVRLYNLCRCYRYQSLGYYVSLLAEARGHKPLPRVSAIEDLQSRNLMRFLVAGLDELVAKSLAPIKSDEFSLHIYFGRSVAARHGELGRQIFERFQAPLLRAVFARKDGVWQARGIAPIAASDIPPRDRGFAIDAARGFLARPAPATRHRRRPRYEMAILHEPENPLPSSNDGALRKFAGAAHAVGIRTEVIGRGDIGRLPHFDALFIRDTTFINHYTYRYARRAAAEGLVVIDDPDSILRCGNKVYLAELLTRHGIPTPRTLLVHRGNAGKIASTLGLPCVLKQPDSSLSLGVARAGSERELRALVARLLRKSELIVAQEYLPTEFDWRVGILDRRPLFVCKYYMVAGHWQIVRHVPGRHYEEGPTVAVPLEQAPPRVISLALKAANLIGDGLYGVDIKQAGRRYWVIEVNDNPTIDAGNEDGILGDALYREIMGVFARRLAARRQGKP